MGDVGTIRERIQRAAAYFHHQEGIVLTTFNLTAAFLEEQVLPIVLGVEAKTTSARRAETHQRLGATPCTVFYDASASPKISGRYRFVARPVPVRGRFFHPKLVIVAGRSEDDTTWVYLAVSSANLSLSGWGRNAECFGETWIHTRQQQTWRALDLLLAWLQSYAPLGEAPADADAVARVRAALARMPDRKRFQNDETEPWSGTLYARLYSSVVDTEGLADFLRIGRSRKAAELWVYSPYWGEVAEQVDAFNARRTVLVPALRIDGSSLGLSRGQVERLPDRVEIRRNDEDKGTRFWHMKAYWILHGDTAFTAVGSCNFTHAGLIGRGGNVEAALVLKADPDWLPAGELADSEKLGPEPLAEEEVPEPTPVIIVVAFDWRALRWRWWLDAGRQQRDFVLMLPGLPPIETGSGTHERQGSPPPRGAAFQITYKANGDEHTWHGKVVELNLDYSARVYGKPLTANEILESWRGHAPTWDLGGGGDERDADQEGDDTEHEIPAAFDAVNLYDLYRSMRALQTRLYSLEAHPDARRALLVGRPDSVMALAILAERDGEAPAVRYLVLQELCAVLRDWRSLLDEDLVARAESMASEARSRMHTQLTAELGYGSTKASDMLDWFEERLSELNGKTP